MVKAMAGIVLYNPEIERLFMEIESVLPQVELICLCDNGSANISRIEDRIGENEKIVIIKNENNLGIGTASNQICAYAEINGFDWVLMLDHDTICPVNLVSTYNKYINDELLGMLCPNVVDKEIARNQYNSLGDGEVEYVKRCIQSATFVKISAWKKCRGYNEWMFIDFVDFDFCKRMEINGFRIARCKTLTVDHQLGKREKTRNADFFMKLYNKTGKSIFKYFTYKNEFSELRTFYCARNNIAYIKLFANYIDTKKEWRIFFYRIFKKVVRSKNRLMIIRETIKGTYSGLKTKMEPYKPE
ncbi:glycosyltransferase [Clostridiaceae bacterium AF31-3BH]|nr:glycosyltransferase [Clostridiaceae bacterium AF31-3BH]